MFVRLSGWMAGWLALRRFKVVIQTNAEVFVLRFCFEPSFCLAVIEETLTRSSFFSLSYITFSSAVASSFR